MSKKKIIQIIGPTGVGKSSIALMVAAELDGEIISADSMQVYKNFDIGTDKISLTLREQIPHYLIDILTDCSQFNGSIFLKMAGLAVKQIEEKGRLPLVCGGTALYLTLMVKGIFPEVKSDLKLRDRLKNIAGKKGMDILWRRLQKIDPVYASKIDRNDKVRVIRALEIYYNNKQPPSQVFSKTVSAFDKHEFIRIGLNIDRKQLYQRIEDRVDKMIRTGLVEEVKSLLERYPRNCPPFRSLGYKEVLMFLDHKMDFAETVTKIKQHSRNYAKRQLTWFRKEQDINWFDATNYKAVISFLKSKLADPGI